MAQTPFEYKPFDRQPYVGAIGALLQKQGETAAQYAERIAAIRGQQAQQTAQAWSGAVQGIGNDVSRTIQQANDPVRQMQQLQVKNAISDQAGEAQADQIVRGLRGPNGEMPSRSDVIKQLSDSPNPIPLKVQTAVLNYHNIAETAAQQDAERQAERRASAANLVYETLHHMPDGATPDQRVNAAVQALEAAQQTAPTYAKELQPLMDAVKSGSDPMALAVNVMRGSPAKRYEDILKPITLAPTPSGGAPAKVVGPTGPVATGNEAPPKTVVVNGQVVNAQTAEPIGSQIPKQAEPPQPGSEGDWVARARRLAVQKNDGQPLSDADLQAVDAKAMQDFKSNNADPEMRAAALAQKNIAESLARVQLDQQPTKEQAASVADDLVHHRIAPEQLASLFSTRGREGLAFKLAVTAEAKKQDPNFNFEEASAEYNLTRSPGFQNTVRYMDSVRESMPRLQQTANALGNSNVKFANGIVNMTKDQLNDPTLKAFRTDVLLVGDEVAKILQGGGSGSATSDAKLNQAAQILGTSDSPQAIKAALGEINTLIGYRRGALTRGTYMEGSAPAKTSTVLVIKDGKLVPQDQR